MADEEKKAPELRFKGFLDDWEQRKFEEMLDKNDGVRRGPFGSALKKEIFVKNSDYVVYEQQNAIYDNYKTRYNITKEKFDELHKFSLKENDFIMSGAGTIGRISRVPKGIKKGVFNQALIRFRINNELTNPEYFLQFVRAENMQRKLTGANPGSAISNLVPMSEVKKWEVFVPIKAEQKKLGSFFEQLDDTIALHQRMSDKQKNLKANLLQMMFPRNGEKIPEVRLAGFVEDWSQRTLEDISDKVTEKNKAREFTETLTNSAEYGIISQSDYFDKDISNINNIDGYYVVRPDDFVYNPRISNFAPVGPIKRNNLNRIGIMSPLYYVFRPKRVDHTFLEKYFETSYWHIFMKMNGDSGARADRFAIKDTILKEMPIPYPIMEEQVKIGIFFNQLDKSIVLHQEKIAHLKILKSTLLNKMFI